jgi:hypothetical protein
VGTLSIIALVGVVTFEDPSPGDLSRPHAGLRRLDTLAGCEECHAKEGLTAGCLSCHGEIRAQQESRSGYHGRIAEECASCHPEHNGAEFGLAEAVAWGETGPTGFDHSHLEFTLDGKHEALSCEACHRGPHVAPFALAGFPDRKRADTYLGLTQKCAPCHADVHGDNLFLGCQECHDQAAFRPASRFDHARHFVLEGPHREAECSGCHRMAEAKVFHEVKGETCRECHENPHRSGWEAGCEGCHRADDDTWHAAAAAFTPELHSETGFPLLAPHDRLDCVKCHEAPGTLSYEERFPVPEPGGHAQAEDHCGGCHRDVHSGQFEAKYASCLDCHLRESFEPHQFGEAEHDTFKLAGAHARARCDACHSVDPETAVRRFVGSPRSCGGCHEDIHEWQFQALSVDGDCSLCHDQSSFTPARFGIAQHSAFPLTGAHLAVSCRDCHKSAAEGRPRRFLGTETRCKSCHADPHGSQFAAELKRGDCTSCHRADSRTFAIRPYDHRAEAGYALEGAHAETDCSSCHSGGAYRGTPTHCGSCHVDVHRGQLARKGVTRCESCHTSSTAWPIPKFDHTRHTRFPLDKAHAKVACAECHLSVRQPDGSAVVQYRPLGTECRSCHEFTPR